MQSTEPEVSSSMSQQIKSQKAKLVHVAVGVVANELGQVLIALRSPLQHQGGLWEFPGGKVEVGEALLDALQREFLEEVNLQVLNAEPLLKIHHDYKDKQVLLDVHLVTEFSGSEAGREGQELRWVAIKDLKEFEFPEANKAIVLTLQSLVSSSD